jgi:bifunctional non-homologous end joining protein LigD
LPRQPKPLQIPPDQPNAELALGVQKVSLTNLQKMFWPEDRITKRDLLQYYADISPFLLPHLAGRAMVMKRYPDGAAGPFFFQKRAPDPRPKWIPICTIPHPSASLVKFPVIQDLAGLLWVVNLGCIDLNPWYARCDDTDRPDYLHFDLDPTPQANFKQVLEAALLVRDALAKLKIPSFPKTTGSRGVHVYVPILRGPLQKQVWTFAKALAKQMESAYPKIITAEHKVAKRPPRHILVDYNQNAWGRTLASVYSVRPKPHATVSAPVTWQEVEQGIKIEDFRLDNMLDRVKDVGDLFRPLLLQKKPGESGPASMKLPLAIPFAPMEAKVASELPTGSQWDYEPKWDGFRCLAFRNEKDVQLQSKAGRPLTRYFPEVVAALLKSSAGKFVLDGELIVPIQGRLSFDHLLQRIHPASSRVAMLSKTHPAQLVVFDLLVDEDSASLVSQPLEERRRRLEAFHAAHLAKTGGIRLSRATRSRAVAQGWLESMRGQLDGIVAKRIDQPYISGERAMLKIKTIRSADCVVGGFRYGSGKQVVGSLLLGLYDEGGLFNHAGFTSSMPSADRKTLTQKACCPFVNAEKSREKIQRQPTI